jgi:predicted GH43/DUF377 family glycosyl hydrolase
MHDLVTGSAGAFELRRLGTVMEPEPRNPHEIEGVLNPAAARGPDGNLYLFPRLVAAGNYSRIGIARVRFNGDGDPTGVERLGIALEPEADYELRPSGGGCEDPRVTFVAPLASYVMTYTAFSPEGPRIALALSKDLFHWQRMGLVSFTNYHTGVDPDGVDDKDASLFPVVIPNPSGRPELAILHRPLFPGTRPEETAVHAATRTVDLNRESIWISFCERAPTGGPLSRFGRFASHHRLASPVSPWERLKIGGGTPPILTRHGWLIVYHGVSEVGGGRADAGHQLCYSAGAMVLSKEHPQMIRYRSVQPVLAPELPQERKGTVANVVFPTGIDRRDDLGMPDRFDVYYGMADDRIGVARLDLPEALPLGGLAHSPGVKV